MKKVLYAHMVFRILCVEHRLISIEYFMDKMRPYEVNDYMKSLKYIDRTVRELERFSNYIYVQSNTKKEIKLKDILELPWDKENKEEHHYSKEEEQILRKKANYLQMMLESGNVKYEEAKLA